MRYVVLAAFLLLTAFGGFMAIPNMHTDRLVDGGWIYNELGEKEGLWDRWERVEYPMWVLPVYFPLYAVFESPLWYKTLYSGAVGLFVLFWILPYISLRTDPV